MRLSVWTALVFAIRARAQTATTSALSTTTVIITATVSTNAATTETIVATVTSYATVTGSSNSTSTSTTTTSDVPVVTNQAYIDTVLRHHNYHRMNHTSPDVDWDDNLAEIARKITTRCVFEQDLYVTIKRIIPT